jgi:hypothetical protein
MSKEPVFPTPLQNIALNWVFHVMGECRFNRRLSEYLAIAARLPPLKVLHWKVNEALRQYREYCGRHGIRLPQICRFKPGDERWDYEDYPSSLSKETIREALVVSGMRPRRPRAKSLRILGC